MSLPNSSIYPLRVTRFTNCVFFQTNVNWHYAKMSENRSSHVLTYLAPKKWPGNVRKPINFIRQKK